MDMFIVEGGHRLCGRTRVSGAKNAALPIMAAAIMSSGRLTLQNIPQLVDIHSMQKLLDSLGVVSHGPVDGQLVLQSVDQSKFWADYELVRKMRASFCVLGPLLARRKQACVSLPGGCQIGERPVDLHLKGLTALGAEIKIERGYVVARAARLKGARINLQGPHGSTVTGTCNVMSAATLAIGTTIIEHAAIEPEVVDLGTCLNKMGAKISGLGTDRLVIEGVKGLNGTIHKIIPDRIEAATLMLAAAITGGDVILEECPVGMLTSVIEKLTSAGVKIEHSSASDISTSEKQFIPEMGLVSFDEALSIKKGIGQVEVTPAISTLRISRTGPLKPITCNATPYPGLPTDIQAQLTSLLSCAPGQSIVEDQVFQDRFMHIMELNRMGANITRQGNRVNIEGRGQLTGAIVMASDLRASAALVLAGLVAQGESVIRRIYHLDRGYEQLEKKLCALGAVVRRMEDSPENIPISLRTPPLKLDLDSSKSFRIDQPHQDQQLESKPLETEEKIKSKPLDQADS